MPINLLADDNNTSNEPVNLLEGEQNKKQSLYDKFQDFMQPKQIDQQGNPMTETFLGRMAPINRKEFTPGTKEYEDSIKEVMDRMPISPGMNIANKAPSLLKSLFTKTNPKKMVESVQKGHDVLEGEAKGIYEYVKNKAKNVKMKVDNNLIDDAEAYLPKTDKVKLLIQNAKTGSYDALHDLQSELWQLGKKGLSSDLPSAINYGHEMLDIRSKINKAMEGHFSNIGQADLAHLLKKGRGLYKNLKDTYFTHSGIGKMVDPNIRKTPRNIVNFFSEESKPMQDVLNKHPEVGHMLKSLTSQKKAIKHLNNILSVAGKTGFATGGLGAALYGGDILLNKLLGNK